MRKPLLLLAALFLVALPVVALAGGVPLHTGVRFEFTDCASGGSAAQTVTAGTYLLRVTDSDAFICFAASGATCASGGEKFPMGTVMLLEVKAGLPSLACRSSGSSGDVILTLAQ